MCLCVRPGVPRCSPPSAPPLRVLPWALLPAIRTALCQVCCSSFPTPPGPWGEGGPVGVRGDRSRRKLLSRTSKASHSTAWSACLSWSNSSARSQTAWRCEYSLRSGSRRSLDRSNCRRFSAYGPSLRGPAVEVSPVPLPDIRRPDCGSPRTRHVEGFVVVVSLWTRAWDRDVYPFDSACPRADDTGFWDYGRPLCGPRRG